MNASKPSLARSRGEWFSVHVTIALLFGGGVGLVVVGAVFATRPGDLWADVAKAGITVGVITVAGLLGTIAVHRVEERRASEARSAEHRRAADVRAADIRRARDTELRRFLHDVLSAYNSIKAARRHLRALGLADADQLRKIGADQARELRSVLAQLNTSQLLLESLKRETPASGLFIDPEAVRTCLSRAEKFINKTAIESWKKAGGALWEGTSLTGMRNAGLDTFLDDDENSFEAEVSQQLDALIDIIKRELLTDPPLVTTAPPTTQQK